MNNKILIVLLGLSSLFSFLTKKKSELEILLNNERAKKTVCANFHSAIDEHSELEQKTKEASVNKYYKALLALSIVKNKEIDKYIESLRYKTSPQILKTFNENYNYEEYKKIESYSIRLDNGNNGYIHQTRSDHSWVQERIHYYAGVFEQLEAEYCWKDVYTELLGICSNE